MKVFVDIQPPVYYSGLHELIRLGFPGTEISRSPGGEDTRIEITCLQGIDQSRFEGTVIDGTGTTQDQLELTNEQIGVSNLKKELRKFVYRLLCQHLQRNINQYGILTGMRPVKTVHYLLDQGVKEDDLSRRLQEAHLMEESKANLLCKIGENNRPYLHEKNTASGLVSIYIGIPFCPSRCYYCSFPGAILNHDEQTLVPFIHALKKELHVIGEELDQLGLSVETIYVGGGTPTVLSEKELEDLFSLLHEKFISPVTREITVEAGRPDTLSLSKIKRLKNMGVNRLCVNPQTMNDATLKRIGRQHGSSQIVEAVEWTRQAGIEEINMDLILGLPGEGMNEFMHTCREVILLHPSNITVHSLAVKRGSELALREGISKLADSSDIVSIGIDTFRTILQDHGYDPYYLYRQKYIKANMENTGYAIPGHYCIYNIQTMEERQTILGMGGGASSKFVNPGNWSLINFHNPKDPAAYINTVDRLISAKVDKLRGLN